MSQRERIRMTDEEVDGFLHAGRTLQLATIGPAGAPHLVPMWYAVVDGHLAFWTYARSQKALNLRRDPRLTCLVEAGDRYEELRGVQIRGRAEIMEDFEAVVRVGEAVYQRYRGPLDDEARAGVAREGRKRVAILVVPEHVATWDHRKLHQP